MSRSIRTRVNSAFRRGIETCSAVKSLVEASPKKPGGFQLHPVVDHLGRNHQIPSNSPNCPPVLNKTNSLLLVIKREPHPNNLRHSMFSNAYYTQSVSGDVFQGRREGLENSVYRCARDPLRFLAMRL